MTDHNPAAVLVSDCLRCSEKWAPVSLHQNWRVSTEFEHAEAVRDAYLAERARVAELERRIKVVEHRSEMGVGACLNAYRNGRADGQAEVVAAVAPFRNSIENSENSKEGTS